MSLGMFLSTKWGSLFPTIPKEWSFKWNLAWGLCFLSMPYLIYLTMILKLRQEIHASVPFVNCVEHGNRLRINLNCSYTHYYGMS